MEGPVRCNLVLPISFSGRLTEATLGPLICICGCGCFRSTGAVNGGNFASGDSFAARSACFSGDCNRAGLSTNPPIRGAVRAGDLGPDKSAELSGNGGTSSAALSSAFDLKPLSIPARLENELFLFISALAVDGRCWSVGTGSSGLYGRDCVLELAVVAFLDRPRCGLPFSESYMLEVTDFVVSDLFNDSSDVSDFVLDLDRRACKGSSPTRDCDLLLGFFCVLGVGNMGKALSWGSWKLLDGGRSGSVALLGGIWKGAVCPLGAKGDFHGCKKLLVCADRSGPMKGRSINVSNEQVCRE
jgi:hypothetical protein